MKEDNKFLLIAALIIILCFIIAHSMRGQIKIEPIAGIDIFTSKTMSIKDPGDESYIMYLNSEGLRTPLIHHIEEAIDYDVTVGLKVNYKNLYVESTNVISCMTTTFFVNNPYNVNFYMNFYYKPAKNDKIKFGYEHLCIHPISSENQGLYYKVRGSHDKIYFHYNF